MRNYNPSIVPAENIRLTLADQVANGATAAAYQTPATTEEAIARVLANANQVSQDISSSYAKADASNVAANAAAWRTATGLGTAATANLGEPNGAASLDQNGQPVEAGRRPPFRQLARDAVLDAFQPPRAADVPVISIAAGSSSTISGAVLHREKRLTTSTSNLDILGDPKFRYKGIPSASDAFSAGNFVDLPFKDGADSVFAKWNWNIEFDTASPEVEFRMRQVTANQAFWLMVNGRWVSEQEIPRVVTGGASYVMKLTFPTSDFRRIEVRFVGQEGFGGVYTSPGFTIVKPTQAIRRRIAIVGDSITNGSGTPPNGAGMWETFALRLGYLMGGDDIILAGVGSTGYVATAGGNAASTFAGRIPTIRNFPGGEPHVWILVGSQNDSGPTAAALQAAVETTLDLIPSSAEVYGFGSWIGSSTINNAIAAGFASRGRWFFDDSVDFFGTGRVGAITGDGNNDFYKTTDSVHPTFAGHKYRALQMYARIMGGPPLRASLAEPMPFGSAPVYNSTIARTLNASQNRGTFTNTGATALTVFTLPSASAGLEFSFAVLDTDGIRVTAAAGNTIRVGASVSAAAGRIDSTTVGDTVRLLAVDSTQWIAAPAVGTWTVT